MSDRETLELQTRRNLDGMDLEREGRVDEAIALYEQNVAEGFEGDWPYGRLVAYYERVDRLDEAERVLNRAIEVFKGSKRRTGGIVAPRCVPSAGASSSSRRPRPARGAPTRPDVIESFPNTLWW
jgi:tetratricopeptide (TPR) repeat protein